MSGTVIARGGDRLLDVSVVLLAAWTGVYHLSLFLGVGSDAALVVTAVLLVAIGVLSAIAQRRPVASGAVRFPATQVTPSRSGAVAVVAALGAATGMALSAPWLLVWVAWLVAALAGTTYAAGRLRHDQGVPEEPTTGLVEAAVVVVVALALGVLATFTLRPNPDDLFYVNLSQWVADNGTFPLRDTLYSNLGYPLANWPPAASYDGLTGALAHLIGVPAGTVVYVVVPPLITVLSTLALWRLLRAWRVRYVAVAVLAAVVFLLFDGTSSYGPPGNLWLTRMWQGKVILLCLLVPVLFVRLLRYAERPDRGRVLWLVACGVAAVGLTTTAVFLVPIVALAGVAPLLVRGQLRSATVGFAATAGYPLAVGVFTVATGGRSADDFGIRRQFRFDPEWFGHAVFLTGVVALLGVAAVLVGAVTVPHPMARVTTGVAALVTGITFVPGVTWLSYGLVGLGPTLWRVSWVCTVAALVGVLASWAAERLRRRGRVVAAVVSVALLAGFGHPVLGESAGTSFAPPPHWQRGEGSRDVTAWMLANTETGDIVLAPESLSITVAVTTTDIKVVAPRDYYLDYLRNDPRFNYDDRIELTRMVNRTQDWDPAAVAGALKTLDVRTTCLFRHDVAGAVALAAAQWHQVHLTEYYRCLAP